MSEIMEAQIQIRGSNIIAVGFFIILSGAVATAAATAVETIISFNDGFDQTTDTQLLKFVGDQAAIHGGALQLTPDTINSVYSLVNRSGRIMWHEPIRLWDGDTLASFNTSFLINLFRQPNWTAGEGLAFLIAPNYSIPADSHGQWLGLTDAATDGNNTNQIVAIEFDTMKQEYDPDNNHIGLDINSVVSVQTVSLGDHNIQLCPQNPANYSVWVNYHGSTKLIEVYMAEAGKSKPEKPLLNYTVDLRRHVKQESYLGFAASTGSPDIQLNCVLQWQLDVEVLPHKNDWKWLKIGGPVIGGVTGISLVVAAILYHKIRRKGKMGRIDSLRFHGTMRRLPGIPREFRYSELKKATSNFDQRMRLGHGGFGTVYKGILCDADHGDSEVAVKKFSKDTSRGRDDFLAELIIIHRLRHKHLVHLVGWCHEKRQLLLVYDLMPNGSLDKHLFSTSADNTLNWERRYNILADVASALRYLHHEYNQMVVHRDLKASNILLDSDFNARIGDFGLARAIDNKSTSYDETGTKRIQGTAGYVAPECFYTGNATPESDVFSFGQVVLEVVCGKHPGTRIQHDQGDAHLVDWVWTLHREGRILEAVDDRLGNDYSVDEAERLLQLGLACSHTIASERPQTKTIVQIISKIVPPPNVPPFRPVFRLPSMDITSTHTTLSISNHESVEVMTS